MFYFGAFSARECQTTLCFSTESYSRISCVNLSVTFKKIPNPNTTYQAAVAKMAGSALRRLMAEYKRKFVRHLFTKRALKQELYLMRVANFELSSYVYKLCQHQSTLPGIKNMQFTCLFPCMHLGTFRI